MTGYGVLFGSVDAVHAVRFSLRHNSIVAIISQIPGGRTIEGWQRTVGAREWKRDQRLAIDKVDLGTVMEVSPSGDILGIVTSSGCQFIDMATRRVIAVTDERALLHDKAIEPESDGPTAIAFSPDSNHVVVGTRSGFVVRYSLLKR